MKKQLARSSVKGACRAANARHSASAVRGAADTRRAGDRQSKPVFPVGLKLRAGQARAAFRAGARPWDSYPPGSRARALLRKLALRAYFTAILNGKPRAKAERCARIIWFRESGEMICGRSIRRWAGKVQLAGGLSRAPLTAYCDGKSCPHQGTRKAARLDKRKRAR